VIKAILDVKDMFLYWPIDEERSVIGTRFAIRFGLPGAVRIIDVTDINMYQRPGWKAAHSSIESPVMPCAIDLQ
jgi:hypothetical protein